MTLLTREFITRKSTFEMVEVDVSEWGNPGERTTVFVREMSAYERGEFETERLNKKGKVDYRRVVDRAKHFRARLAVATCCDADGTLIFQPEDFAILTEKPSKVLDRICAAALKVNCMTEDDIEDEEETVKN